MPVTRQIARPLLASMFIVGGLDAVRNPEPKAKKAEPVALPIAQRVPGLPEDPVRLVQINGAVQLTAGSLLAIGKFRRLAALALIGSVIPTTYAGHRWWEIEDEATRAQQRIHFLKNLGLLGGLILAAVDTEGRPSVGWWARRQARQAAKMVELGREIGVLKAGQAAGQLGQVAEQVTSGGRRGQQKAAAKAAKARAKSEKAAAQAAARARAEAVKAAALANKAAAEGRQSSKRAAKEAKAQARVQARELAEQAKQLARQAKAMSGPAAKDARAQAKVQARELAEQARELAKQARAKSGPAVAALGASTQQARAIAAPAVAAVGHRAGELLSTGTEWAGERAGELRSAAGQRLSA